MSQNMLRRLTEKSTQKSDTSHSPIEIIYRLTTDLQLDPANPRVHSKQQIHRIAKSIKSFGFNVPVLINKTGGVIAGHGRVLAATEIGLEKVPTICLDHLTAAQARAFMIADNRLTEIATWDERLLAEQLKDLADLDLRFDLEATGFDMGEIDFRIQGLADAAPATPDSADNVPTDSGPPVTRLGDPWILGRHHIYCGSALEEASYAELMAGKTAAMVFADPPYNVAIQGHVSGLGRIKHREFAMASGEMSEPEYTAFLTQAFRLMAAHSAQGSIHYACADWRHLSEYLEAGKAVYSELKNLCVWAKDNAGMGSLYRSQHELVFVFKNGKTSHRNNVQLGRFGRRRSNVWSYLGVNSFARTSDEGNLLALHPTVKPVAMVADAILDCSGRGDGVLDPFLGSGTTILAAERTGRVAYGIELEPHYVDVAIRRWQAYTGERARHGLSGRPFGALRLKVRHG